MCLTFVTTEARNEATKHKFHSKVRTLNDMPWNVPLALRKTTCVLIMPKYVFPLSKIPEIFGWLMFLLRGKKVGVELSNSNAVIRMMSCHRFNLNPRRRQMILSCCASTQKCCSSFLRIDKQRRALRQPKSFSLQEKYFFMFLRIILNIWCFFKLVSCFTTTFSHQHQTKTNELKLLFLEGFSAQNVPLIWHSEVFNEKTFQNLKSHADFVLFNVFVSIYSE